MQKEIKEELIKRYKYLYVNKELILSLAINKAIEVEYITKKLEELNKSKRILKKYKKRIDYASLEELINISINDLEKKPRATKILFV